MTPELETYFNNYNQLFNSQGFKQLLEELVNNSKELSDVRSVKDVEELFFRKGQIAAFATIITLEDMITVAREQAEEEEEDV
jgi:hypothetical protein|tara:strand:- start:2267 stop:2512 length:246 start_codon:yes stop_codon:yes gene_type:complete